MSFLYVLKRAKCEAITAWGGEGRGPSLAPGLVRPVLSPLKCALIGKRCGRYHFKTCFHYLCSYEYDNMACIYCTMIFPPLWLQFITKQINGTSLHYTSLFAAYKVDTSRGVVHVMYKPPNYIIIIYDLYSYSDGCIHIFWLVIIC